MKYKKLGILLLPLLIAGCSTPMPVMDKNTTETSSFMTSGDYRLTPQDIQELDEEYTFSTKALTKSYVYKKVKKWLDTSNGPKLVKELKYAKFKGVLVIPFADMITDHPELREPINTNNDVIAARTDSEFNTFLTNTCPPETPTNIIYVKAGASGDGTSWTNAYGSLQDALSAATSGNEIWVAAGTYTPGTLTSDTFQLKDGVNIYGGFAGTETQLAQRNFNTNVVILSGDIADNDTEGDLTLNKSDNSIHVVTGANNLILDGVTIKFGNASSIGGGMWNSGVSPSVSNVIFSNNIGGSAGGGIFYGDITAPVSLTNVTFEYNKAGNAAGMWIGIASSGSASVTMSNVIFKNNEANNAYGGGMQVSGTSSNILPITLTNVTFSGNSGKQGGGGFYAGGYTNSTLKNVIFADNTSLNSPGTTGMQIGENGTVSLTNVTFYNNKLGNVGGTVTVNNSIFWGITNPITNSNTSITAILNIGYSDIQDGFAGIIGNGTKTDLGGNINVDPLFVSTSTPINLALTGSSPALVKDAGNSEGTLLTDITGAVRPGGTGNSMGAYEQ